MRLMQLACVILALLHFKIKYESKIVFRTMNIIETWSICLFGEGIRSKVAISFIFGVMNELDKSNEKYCTRYSRRVTELVLFQKDSYFNKKFKKKLAHTMTILCLCQQGCLPLDQTFWRGSKVCTKIWILSPNIFKIQLDCWPSDLSSFMSILFRTVYKNFESTICA